MKAVMATTWDSKCGIAEYSKSLVGELKKRIDVQIANLDPDEKAEPSHIADLLNCGDIAHIQFQYPFFGGMAFHRNWFNRLITKLQVPTAVTVHEIDLGETSSKNAIRKYKQWFNRRIFTQKGIDCLIVHTNEYKQKLVELGCAPNIIRILPEGVPNVEPADLDSNRAKIDIALADKKVVTMFGFVVQRKGCEIALDALSHLPEDTILLIAGGTHPGDNTGYFENLQQKIRSDGLSRRVVITGYLPEDKIRSVMAATDVIIAPFTAMSNSSSIMRSIAYGKPIIASDLPATREINERLPCLMLFEKGNAEELVNAIKTLTENDDERQKSIDLIKRYSQEFSVAWSAEQTLNVYNELRKSEKAK